MLKLIVLIVPLGLDTFVVSTGLGLQALRPRERLRLCLVLASFEAGMPLVGLSLGRVIGGAVGSAADYVAIAILGGLGLWMLLSAEDSEDDQVRELSRLHGPALVAVGISVSLDELAMGFSIGLLHVSAWLAIVLIGAQAGLVAQLGMRVGARLRAAVRDRAERGAAVTLIGLAGFLLAERLSL